MKFIYTEHIKLRIKQRAISKDKIERAILNPDNMLPSFKGRCLAQRKFNGRRLEVAYKKLVKARIVITAYWLKEAR